MSSRVNALGKRGMALLDDLRTLYTHDPAGAERVRAALQAELMALTVRTSLTEKAGL